MDSLCFGVLLAYVYQMRPQFLAFVPKWRVPLLAIGCLFLSPMVVLDVQHPFVWTIGLTTTYLGYGLILLACVDAKHGIIGNALRGRIARVIAFVGFYSYSIYLWHGVAAGWLIPVPLSKHGLIRWLVLMPAFAILATLIGFVAAKLVEQPALRLRDRWYPRLHARRVPAADDANPVASPLNLSIPTGV